MTCFLPDPICRPRVPTATRGSESGALLLAPALVNDLLTLYVMYDYLHKQCSSNTVTVFEFDIFNPTFIINFLIKIMRIVINTNIINKIVNNFFICIDISAYCSDPPPNLNGGTCGSPNTTTVHCWCSSGYQSTGGAQPYLTCTYFNSSHGFWYLTYSCFALYAFSITHVVTKIACFNSPLSPL